MAYVHLTLLRRYVPCTIYSQRYTDAVSVIKDTRPYSPWHKLLYFVCQGLRRAHTSEHEMTERNPTQEQSDWLSQFLQRGRSCLKIDTHGACVPKHRRIIYASVCSCFRSFTHIHLHLLVGMPSLWVQCFPGW